MQTLRGARYQNLIAFGDSLTAGTGATGGLTYPQQTADLWPRGRWHYNGGVGGDTSSQILTRYIAAEAWVKRGTLLIWAGRNNFASGSQVKSDIAAIVAEHTANAGNGRYLVLSVTTAIGEANPSIGYTQITTLNSDLAATYGAHFVDVLSPLVAAGAPTGLAPDATAFAGGYPPSGLRFDAVHLNNAGYAIVAAAVYAKLASFGW